MSTMRGTHSTSAWRAVTLGLVFGGAVALYASQLAAQAPGSADRRLTVTSPAVGRRLALVVGNNTYPSAPLRNAVADATTVSAGLRDVGFDVTVLTDVGFAAMERAVDTFVARLQADDVALVYFSGHGVQVDGDNYLVPVDFRGVDEVDLKYGAYSATRLHDKMAPRARVRLLILDACRDNPFKASRGGTRGLAEMTAQGSLIAFATAPGSTASDNPQGRNGLFTEHLLAALKEPGLSASELFRRVRARVNEASGGRQFPWIWDGLIGEFSFRAGTSAAPAPPSAATDSDLALRAELALWESIKDSTSIATFEAYLREYPNGRYRIAAVDRLERLRPAPAAAAPAASATFKVKSDQLTSASIEALTGDCGIRHAAACYEAARRYDEGRGVAKSDVWALRYFEQACDAGYPSACGVSAYRYFVGIGATTDQVRANALYRRGCDAGHWISCGNLGISYRDGVGIAEDLHQATTLFQLACDRGDARSCTNWGRMYQTGRGVSQDAVRAASLYERGCESGDALGCNNWGVMFMLGSGVETNPSRAVELFKRSCSGTGSDSEAAGCRNLGRAYEEGAGVDADRAQALEHYRKACDGGDTDGCAAVTRLGGQR